MERVQASTECTGSRSGDLHHRLLPRPAGKVSLNVCTSGEYRHRLSPASDRPLSKSAPGPSFRHGNPLGHNGTAESAALALMLIDRSGADTCRDAVTLSPGFFPLRWAAAPAGAGEMILLVSWFSALFSCLRPNTQNFRQAPKELCLQDECPAAERHSVGSQTDSCLSDKYPEPLQNKK